MFKKNGGRPRGIPVVVRRHVTK